jgi:hypothetical protein
MGRNIDADLRHFREIRAFAAQQLFVVAIAIVKGVDKLFSHWKQSRKDE